MTTFFKIQNFIDILNDMAPFSHAAEWDNVGLMIGNPEQRVSGILLGLDPTIDLLDQAIKQGHNTILTHHPLIFHPLKTIRPDYPPGSLIKKGLADDLSILACHTNLDVVPGGVSDVLARKLGLENPVPLQLTDREELIGYGRVGTLPGPVAGTDFLDRLHEIFRLPVLPVAGQPPETISKVAVCGGSGSELAETAFKAGADIYITAEIKHSTARWAEACNFCIVDGSHFATENVVIKPLAARLKKIFKNKNIEIPVEVGEQKNSITFLTLQ